MFPNPLRWSYVRYGLIVLIALIIASAVVGRKESTPEKKESFTVTDAKRAYVDELNSISDRLRKLTSIMERSLESSEEEAVKPADEPVEEPADEPAEEPADDEEHFVIGMEPGFHVNVYPY